MGGQSQTDPWKIVVFGKIADAGVDMLRADGRFSLFQYPDHPPERVRLAADADAVIVRMTAIDATLIDAAAKLKFVARHGVGYDTVDVDALTRRNIPLAILGDVNSSAVAEHALALMLGLSKRLTVYDRAVRAGNFAIRDSFGAGELEGRTVLLVGYGRIGRKVAARCRAFGMRVTVFDPYLDARSIADDAITGFSDLHDALGQADMVSIHAPKTPETTRIIDADAIAAMKPSAFIVNVARGGLIDEAALDAALVENRIAGAGLDVFEKEPPPGDHPLLRHESVIVSPHSAAFTRDCADRMSAGCAENVIAFFSGRVDAGLVVNRETLGNDRQRNGDENA